MFYPPHPLLLLPLGGLVLAAMAHEEMRGLGKKRTLGGGRWQETAGEPRPGEPRSASGSQGTSVSEILGDLPTTLGSGTHEKPVLEALMLGVRDLSMEVQEMKAVVVESWEIPMDCNYVTKGIELKDQYINYCRQMKGKGEDLGHMKNYVFLGLYIAAKMDGLDPQQTEAMETIVGKRVRDQEGVLDASKAPMIAHLVGYCQVSKSKKKGFVNIHLRGTEGEEVMTILRNKWAKIGRQQFDPTTGKPVHRDIKEGIQEMNRNKNRMK